MELNGYETIIALLSLILASLFWFIISLRNEMEDDKRKFKILQDKFGILQEQNKILQEQNDALKINLEESRRLIDRLRDELKSAKSREKLLERKITELTNKLNESHETQRALRIENDSIRLNNSTSMLNALDLHHFNYHEPKV